MLEFTNYKASLATLTIGGVRRSSIGWNNDSLCLKDLPADKSTECLSVYYINTINYHLSMETAEIEHEIRKDQETCVITFNNILCSLRNALGNWASVHK